MVDYNTAIKLPFSDWKKFWIGSLVGIIPIVNFILVGFGLKTAVDRKLSNFSNPGELFVTGFLGVIISLIYFIPAAIFIIPNAASVVNTQTISTTVGIGIALAILADYLLPYALINFVKKQRFKEAFDCSKILKKCFTGKYFVTYLIAAIWFVALGFVAGFLASVFEVSAIGPILVQAPFIYIMAVSLMSMFGQVYKELR